MKPLFLQPRGLYRVRTVLDFGKYKGRYLEEVIRKDPAYIKWVLNNVKGFKMDDSCNNLYNINAVKIKKYNISELQYLFK